MPLRHTSELNNREKESKMQVVEYQVEYLAANTNLKMQPDIEYLQQIDPRLQFHNDKLG